MANVLNVGLVGFGKASRIFHAPLIDASSNLHLHSVVERHSDESQKVYPGVRIVRDISTILADPNISLVVIATPNTTHYPLARQALNAQKHLLIDKPFANTAAEARGLIELASKNNCLLTIYQNRRMDGPFRTVQSLLAKKQLGRIVEYEACYDRFRNYQKPNAWREAALPGSGVLFDLGAHLIDQALVLFGKPESVSADVRIQRDNGVADDSFDIRFNYPELKVTLRAGMLFRETRAHIAVHGTEGSFVKHGLDPQEADLIAGKSLHAEDWGLEAEENWGTLHTTIDGLTFRGKVATLPGDYPAIYQNIFEAITTGKRLLVHRETAWQTIRLIELARESSEQQRTIKVDF